MDRFSKKYALIVGVTQYDANEQISALPFAANDALSLDKILRENCGFLESNIWLLSQQGNDDLARCMELPTRAGILNALEHIATSADDDSLVVIYFAGHGAEISKSPYLITADTRMNVLDETAVDIRSLNRRLENSRARCILRIFDACRSPFSIGRDAVGRMTSILEDAICAPAQGWITLNACSSGERAYEFPNMEQGLFTYYLCQGIKGLAANPEGHVTLESLIDYIKTSVTNWCHQQSLRQTPHVQSDFSGAIVFSSVEAENPTLELPTDNPLSDLHLAFDSHLIGLPDDARDLTFTSDSEFATFSRMCFELTRKVVSDVSGPHLDMSLSEILSIESNARHSPRFVANMKKEGFYSEYKSALVFQLAFRALELHLASCVLTVYCARFSFFYVLWYCVEFQKDEATQSGFAPDPVRSPGWFVFTPPAAVDETKVDNCVRELMKRVSERMIAWTSQLAVYYDARLQAFRKTSRIVE